MELTRLAEALLPLLAEEEGEAVNAAEVALAGFGPRFEAAYRGGLEHKLGLSAERDGAVALADDLLARMAESRADFTLTFRHLCDAAGGGRGGARPVRRPDRVRRLGRTLAEALG